MGQRKFAVTPGFGVGGTVFSPKQLAAIGGIADRVVDVEMTGFKQLYVTAEEERLSEVQEELKAAGLQIHPAGFVTKSLIACQFCRGAEEAGLDVARALDLAIAGIAVPSPLRIGYAGCALGTSEPLLKDIAVVKMKDSYDLYVGGEPKGIKAELAKLLLTGLQAEQLIPAVTRLIAQFQQHGKRKESYRRFVQRFTLEKLREAAEGAAGDISSHAREA